MKLLPLLLLRSRTRNAARSALSRSGFEPADDRERAFVAIGQGDYRKCLALGKAAVDPLLTYVRKNSGVAWGEDAEAVDEYARAVRALRQIGDPASAKPLLEQLREMKNSDSVPVKIDLISALGALGDDFVLSDLDELTQDKNAAIARAARQASDEVRHRRARTKTEPVT